MDVRVDITELQQQISLIDKTVSALQTVCNSIKTKQRKSSAELEGNQFDITTEHIDRTCQEVEKSISQLYNLKEYLTRLLEEIEQYVKCRYEG